MHFLRFKSALLRSGSALLAAVVVVGLSGGIAQADTSSVISIGNFGGNSSYGIFSQGGAVSDTGSVVGVGSALATSGYHAFLYSSSGGYVDLGTFGGIYSAATGISENGSVVVGYANLAGDNIGYAFRWTQATGLVSLGGLGNNGSFANAVSADGNVIVGASALTGDTVSHAFRWTQAGGMQDLGTLGATTDTQYGDVASSAFGVSSDGSVVVGRSYLANETVHHAFMWTQATGMVDLGNFGGNSQSLYSEANAVSGNGLVIVGDSDVDTNITHAFRWTQAGGMTDIGTLGGNYSSASGVSSDGSVIVGEANTSANGGSIVFRWTQATGMQNLNTLLSNAGVNMSGIQLTQGGGISPNGKYITGYGTFGTNNQLAFLVEYGPGNPVVGGDSGNNVIAGLTTGAAQTAATQQLGDNLRATAIESRATANQLLGMTRPMTDTTYAYAGAMYGSALGLAGGQYSMRGVTVLGGVAYGAQDYPGIRQSDAPTVAVAARYTFDDPFGDYGNVLHPFAEIGGWVAPRETLTLTRTYMNGAGFAQGQGSSESTGWAEYGRGGLLWNPDKDDIFTGYGEVGQQSLAFNGYDEGLSSSNPFAATVDNGVVRYGVVRLGGAWSRDLYDLIYAPFSLTLAGAAARSFDVHSGLTVTVPGFGPTTAANHADTWGEFGAQLDAKLTQQVTASVGINGTTGASSIGTVLHGNAGLSYRF